MYSDRDREECGDRDVYTGFEIMGLGCLGGWCCLLGRPSLCMVSGVGHIGPVGPYLYIGVGHGVWVRICRHAEHERGSVRPKSQC